MSINFMAPETETGLKPRIVVVGVGGAGGNAVNNMIRLNLEGVEFVVANTDAQALRHSQADRKIQLGASVTQGLGAGARPEIGRQAAAESLGEAIDHLAGANMVFITAGMGGGTGTGAAPVLAEACRDQGMLTVGVITKPFQFEGAQRMRAAEQGIEELQQFVDTLIIIPNQNLFRVANEKTTFADAFKMADDVLYSGVRGVTDLIVMPGLINLDFADIRTVMSEMGKAMMGTGEAEGDNRAILAAESAISNPLLEDVSMKGAHGVLINITGGPDMTLFEVDEAANRIREEVDSDANIIFGSTFEENLQGVMRVSVVATGIDADAAASPRSIQTSVTPLRPRPFEIQTDSTEPETQDVPTPEVDPYEDAITDEADIEETQNAMEEPAQIDLETAVAESQQDADPNAEPASPPLFDEPAVIPSITSEEPTAQPAPEPVRPKDAFIPPRPVRPEEVSRPAQKDPEPFREAELMNAGEQAPKPKAKGGLISRVTGLGFSGSKTAPAKPAEPSLLQTEPQPVAEAAAAKLQGQDLAPTKAEEEMLEIPAFLRRQAN